MAYTPRTFVQWGYTDDAGNKYRYKVDSDITDQQNAGLETKVGGVAADATYGTPPRSFKPRVAMMYNFANKLARRIPCYTHDAPLYVGAAGSTTLTIKAGETGEPLTFTWYGSQGERRRVGRPTS